MDAAGLSLRRNSITMDKDPNQLYRVLEEGFELDSPEAIAKWRESRRKNFPTTSNIQRKETDKASTVLRGEKFLPKRLNRKIYSYPIKEEKGRGNYREQSYDNTIPTSSWVNRRLPENKSEVLLLDSYYAEVEIDPNGLLIRAKHTAWDPTLTNSILDDEDEGEDAGTVGTAGTSALDSISITDDEDDMQGLTMAEVNPTTSTPITGSSLPVSTPVPALKGLVAYGTDSDLEDGEIEGDAVSQEPERPDIVPISAAKTDIGVGQLPYSSHQYRGQGEQSISGKGHTHAPPNKNSRKRRRNKKKDKNPSAGEQRSRNALQKRRMMRRSDREPTLLRRLLDDQICEERNAVLCGSRFLLQNNFLEGMENSEDMKAEFIDCLRNSTTQEDDQ